MRLSRTPAASAILAVLLVSCGGGADPASTAAQDPRAPALAIAATPLIGEWRIPGETDVLEFRRDGTYQWGPRLAGTYTMLAATRVRMTVVQDGKPVGHLDNDFAVDGIELSLTAPDGAVTKYTRVN